MEDGVYARQGFDNLHPVGEVADTIVDTRQRTTKPFRLTVEDADRMPVRQQLVDDMRTDEAVAANYENLRHLCSIRPWTDSVQTRRHMGGGLLRISASGRAHW